MFIMCESVFGVRSSFDIHENLAADDCARAKRWKKPCRSVPALSCKYDIAWRQRGGSVARPHVARVVVVVVGGGLGKVQPLEDHKRLGLGCMHSLDRRVCTYMLNDEWGAIKLHVFMAECRLGRLSTQYASTQEHTGRVHLQPC